MHVCCVSRGIFWTLTSLLSRVQTMIYGVNFLPYQSTSLHVPIGSFIVVSMSYASGWKTLLDFFFLIFLFSHCWPVCVLCSYVHRNVTMKFLTCEPNLGRVSNYSDEADVFYASPETWLSAHNISSNATDVSLPTHIIMFDELHVRTAAVLQSSRNGYRLCGQFFHTHFPEGRVSMYVVALCSQQWIQAVRQHSTSFIYHL